MKIYTKTGDKGETSLFGGGRVRKDDKRVAAYGAVDELNSFVGVLVAQLTLAMEKHSQIAGNNLVSIAMENHGLGKETIAFLKSLQNRLFDLGAELATGKESFLAKLPRRIESRDIELLEHAIDAMEADLAPLKNFILPGGSLSAAAAHVCRTVSRRAERAMLSSESATPQLVAFINRVSDYFFVLARHLNYLAQVSESEWEK